LSVAGGAILEDNAAKSSARSHLSDGLTGTQTKEEGSMSIWKTAGVSEQPHLTLDAWRCFELPTGALHLLGFCVETCSGRVSTQLVRLELGSRAAVSVSGRRYRLVGKPGLNRDADYVWHRWALANTVASWVDVSPSIWQMVQAYQASPEIRLDSDDLNSVSPSKPLNIHIVRV